jgi:hypothetical protein
MYSYKNGKMRLVETISRLGGESIKNNDEGMNSTMIYCRRFCKYHNVPLVQQ